MSLKFTCIAALAFLSIVNLFVLSSSTRLNIGRGSQDTFDNPNCDSSSIQNRCNCDYLNAQCVNSTACKRCRCSSTYATFLSSNGKNGRCVKNRHLLFISVKCCTNCQALEKLYQEAFSSSFLAQNIKCLMPTQLNKLKGKTCNASEERQHWIWTRNNQLMHVDTLYCLQLRNKSKSENAYWPIVLEECKSSESKQLWKCKEQIVYLKESNAMKLYMDTEKEHSVWGTTYNIQTLNAWTRYQSSDENLCSTASGCYEFRYPQSAIWEIDCLQKSCHKESKIAIPTKLGENNLCFIMWKTLQYLDNNKWKQLSFKDEIFTIEKRNNETFLKLNFKEATNDWSGLIVKLQFYCANDKLTQVNTEDINCIVIKFKGTAIYPHTFPSTVSTADTRIIANYLTTSTSMTSSTDTLSVHLARVPEKNKSDSSHVTITVLCVVIAILILGAGILGFIFYKQRRRRLSANKEAESREPAEDLFTNPIYATIDIHETPPFSGVDAIYQEPQIGPEPGECKVYESIDDKYRDYADVEQNDKRPALQEHPQEHAKGDNIHPVAQRLPEEDQSPIADYPRDAEREEKVLNGKDEQSNDQCHVYHTLEDLKLDG